MTRRSFLAVIGPGVLVAATGVGAGDLAGAGLAGSALGLSVLWAVIVGAVIKFVVTENLARWQIGTGQTVLEGAMVWLGRPVQILFVLYLLPWTFFTGGALISACGVTAHSLLPMFEDAQTGKIVYGVACSLLGLVLVWLGGFKLFERVMAVCIAIMFVVVVVTAVALRPDPVEVLRGLVIPTIPDAGGEGLAWTVVLIGAIGGTLTIICYAYWMREAGRESRSHLRLARIDALVGYSMTAAFGVAMVIIASDIETSGSGANLIVNLADRLAEPFGQVGRVAFLIGAFAAVFSSLLGVWQAVPYVYADVWALRHQVGRRESAVSTSPDTRSMAYRAALVGIAIVPLIALRWGFKDVQQWYAIYGALFLPGLAIALMVLNGRRLGELRNRWWMQGLLGVVVIFFVVLAVMKVVEVLG